MMSDDIKKKWTELFNRFASLAEWESNAQQKSVVFLMRRRMNSHHPQHVIEEETTLFEQYLQELKEDIHKEFQELKALYVVDRLEFQKLVHDFNTEELKIYNAIERCLSDDIENFIIFGD